MSMIVRFAVAALLWATLAFGAVAQDGDLVLDYDAWGNVAERAEGAIQSGKASNEAFESLRSEVVVWRERFLRGQDVNSARIATLRSQIAALGPVPAEGESEADEIADRRVELATQLAKARAPIVSAEEAYSRADGLAREIDQIIRERQANELLSLGPSPLDPNNWAPAWDEFQGSIRAVITETVQAWRSGIRAETIQNALPKILLFVILAIVLLFRGRRMVQALRRSIEAQLPGRVRRFADVFWSLAEFIAPILGLYAAVAAIEATGLLGNRGTILAQAIPVFGVFVFGAYWLSIRLFSQGELLKIPAERATTLRRAAVVLGVMYGMTYILDALSEFEEFSPATLAVLYMPFAVIAGLALWRLGRMLVRVTFDDADADSPVFGQRWLGYAGRITMLFALVGVVLVLIGYLDAGLFLLLPTIATLGLVGTLCVITDLMRRIYSLVVDTEEEGAAAALIPTLLNLLVVLGSLPLFALIWGARTADLTELLARFREGFTVGDARISPEKFLTFVLVFVALYIATRIIQGALRTNVLPKTSIDTGGRTAIVSGVGYIGIFLAALISITTAGIDLSSLAIVAGALSVGIGFGLQNIVQNFVSGIILLIERPVAEGDWIEVGGHTGIVKKISVRSTLIETFDRVDVIVPNGDFIAGAVQNWTRVNNIGRIKVAVGVAYGNDTRKVAAILSEIAQEHPLVSVNPEPGVDFLGFGADSLDFQIRAVLSDVNYSMSVKTEMHHRINERFAEEGIEIPFMQRDIWLRNPEALTNMASSGASLPPAPLEKEPAADLAGDAEPETT